MLDRFDNLISRDGPAALVLREHLTAVDGHDGILCPATFPGGYNVNEFPDGTNVCLVDSAGSQANRIEEIFTEPPYATLVPKITIKAGDKEINLVKASHRAGDAIVRCSPLHKIMQGAFLDLLNNGNAEPLAKIAPTSLVFGAWDSRDTQVKLPRLISSTVRAFNVRVLTRSAQFVPSAEYVKTGLLSEPSDKATKDAYAERGFIHVPATGIPGGVIADGGVRRDAFLALAALRQLAVGRDEKRTLALRRYILGLSLVSFVFPSTSYMRQGCMLVLDPTKPHEIMSVAHSGERLPIDIPPSVALEYAMTAAATFGIGENRAVEFDAAQARRDVAGGEPKTRGRPKKKPDDEVRP